MTLKSKKTDPNNTQFKDPYAQREAAKYSKPIPSRELILHLIEQNGKPLARDEIASHFMLTEEDDLEALRRRLRAMERDGQILFNRQKKYCLVNNRDLIAGRVLGHADGFGFIRPDDGSADLFLSPREMRALMPNDRAVVRIGAIDRKGRREAELVEVLERNTHQVVGRIFTERGYTFVIPDNKTISQDILIPKSEQGEAKQGHIVVVDIIEQPSKRGQPIGKVVEILGEHMAPGMEIEMAIRTHELPYQWPEALQNEIADLSPEVPEASKEGRVDLRKTPLVTIDGEDARDFDDAVFCQKTAKGWKLLVAIADVSHYVAINTALDQEARNRSTSVYFPEQVIPMLPEILSNGLCSLNPKVDRLCMVCELLINHEGDIVRSRFFEGVMCSHARLTYTEVAQMLIEGDAKLCKKNAELLPHLHQLYALYQVMRVKRDQRGAMDFESQETRIIFGAARKIERIVPVQRNDAHKLIEEFMIAANMAAARFLNRKKMPRLLRIHDGPNDEKLASLRLFLNEMGLHLGGGLSPTPLDYMQVVNNIKGRADAHLIQTVLLRSMSQAVYSPEEKGHFGLALDAYTHFTSPIRRYPDLLVHRAIRHCLQGKTPESFYYGFPDMVLLGEQCSANERRADDATRDVTSWLKCEYMLDKVGQDFNGIISAVTGFGFFVELEDIFVEGLVHISNLPQDYFHFDPKSHQLKGERTHKIYRLGDKVSVTVARVDLDEKKIDFQLRASRSNNKRTKSTSTPPAVKTNKAPKANPKPKNPKSGKRKRKPS